jgi:uncharacterized protein YfaS (alpha-2-macroglobulin family)
MPFIILVLFIIAVAVPLIFSQTYKSKNEINLKEKWKKVEEYVEKQRIESALGEIEIILKEADKTNNFQQMIKANVKKIELTSNKDEDEAIKLLTEFDEFAHNSTNITDKSMMLTMLASLYLDYFNANYYVINGRADLENYTPDDIKEWTKSNFTHKIVTLTNEALENDEILKSTKTERYKDLIEKGEDSKNFQPTLFDFLTYRKIDFLTQLSNRYDVFSNSEKDNFKEIILKTYDDLIDFQEKTNNIDGNVYAQLQKLNFQFQEKNETYFNELEQLENRFIGNESIVEIWAEKANYYLNLSQTTEKKEEQNSWRKMAFSVVTDGIKQFKNYKRIHLLTNIQNEILEKKLNVRNKNIAPQNAEIKIEISSTNIKQLKLSVYQINATSEEYQKNRLNQSLINKSGIFPKNKLIHTQVIDIKSDEAFFSIDTTIVINSNVFGIYEYKVEEIKQQKDKITVYGGFTTTNLAFFERNNQSENKKAIKEIFIVDRQTGTPVKDATISSFIKKWNGKSYNLVFQQKFSVNSNNKYELSLKNDGSNILFFEYGDDKYFNSYTNSYYYAGNLDSYKDESTTQISLFTDRAIYRPGQTVFYKGIVSQISKSTQNVVENYKGTISLQNTNGENIAQKEFTTSEFGSFSGSFILPETGLNGIYNLSAGNFYTHFSVESYKRPTFEVKIEKPTSEVRFGENVTIEGEVKSYADFAISNAKVSYKIERRPHFLRWFFPNLSNEIIASATTETDENGVFKIHFTPQKEAKRQSPFTTKDEFYTYHIVADVTDMKGETQQGIQLVSVGDKSLFITTSINDKVEKSSPLKIETLVQTLNGETVFSDVRYKLISLENGTDYVEKIGKNGALKEMKIEKSGTFNSKEKVEIPLKNYRSGMYKLVLSTTDNRGNEIESASNFILYDAKEKRPPIKTYKWISTENTTLNVDEKARIYFGTSTENSSVLYEIIKGNTVLEENWIRFNNEIKLFEIPFKQEYGDEIVVQFTFVKDEQFFTEQIHLTLKKNDKNITPSIAAFRDKLAPNEQVEWTIHISELLKEKKEAELLLSMFDASLDELKPHIWNFNPTYQERKIFLPPWTMKGLNESQSSSDYFRENYLTVKPYEFDRFIDFRFNSNNFGYSTNFRTGTTRRLAGKAFAMNSAVQLDRAEIEEDSAMEFSNEKRQNEATETIQKPAIRTNFNETAFFYPQLRTDENGNIKVTFVAPESLTRWNVKMLAHTKDLFFGQNELQAVTQKELMTTINLPRFVRESDKIKLVGTVTNLSNSPQQPTVSLEIIHPETDKIIQTFTTKSESLIESKATKSFSWDIENLKGMDLVIVKITAQSALFSDGEQRFLPILPDKILVTESKTMTLRPNENRQFTFDSFIEKWEKVDTKNFAIEFSGNPTWYAVQSLPSIVQADGKSSIDYLTGLYANKLGNYIATSNPIIAATFQKWKQESGKNKTLLSNLQKNEELKNILLDETPWIMDAKTETEQKQALGLLFDTNYTKNQMEDFQKKLLSLQNKNGSFSWYQGMPENRYITQEILLNIARLYKLTDENITENHQIWESVNKAIHYLDLEIAKDFFELKKWNKNYLKEQTISNIQLFYLHLRSEFPTISIDSSAKEAVKYYTSQSEKYWTNWSLYGKAMMATVAFRNGNTKLANEILLSIRENAMKTDNLGMYWNANKSSWFWHQRPISTQTAIMEAFYEIKKSQSDVDEMKIWLLRQKQTHVWDSPISTLNAVYSLLNYGSNWLSEEGKVELKIGDETLKTSKTTSGTAYWKETIPTEKINENFGKISATSNNKNGISWGAIYWQYYQNIDEITPYTNEISVSKKLFVEKITNGAKKMVPIEQTTLQKGDKVIVRLVVSTDRDLEFVALKDLRAACFEPTEQISTLRFKEGVFYYETNKDSSTQFFFNSLAKGTYVFEYSLWSTIAGEFSSGIASVQCLYAPEFISHSQGQKIKIKE